MQHLTIEALEAEIARRERLAVQAVRDEIARRKDAIVALDARIAALMPPTAKKRPAPPTPSNDMACAVLASIQRGEKSCGKIGAEVGIPPNTVWQIVSHLIAERRVVRTGGRKTAMYRLARIGELG